MQRIGIRKANNAGLITTTGGNDLYHTLPQVNTNRSLRITKIMAYQNTGANITIRFGTMDRTPGFVPLLPTLTIINGLDNEWTEEEIPNVEWQNDTTPGAAGRTGNIIGVCTAAGALVRLEVEEFGESGGQ